MDYTLKALDPNYILVDERTVRDRLYFVARFAEQLYFYDEQNKKNGNWSPFFLKDPAILLAYISKTNYKSHYAAYSQIIRKWEVCQDKDQAVLSVFFMLHNLFITINSWVVGMEMCDKKYQLKEFVNKQVGEIQSANLSDVLALWNWWAPWLEKELKEKDATIQLPDFNIFEKFQRPWCTKKTGKKLADLLPIGPEGAPEQETVDEAFSYLQRAHRDTFDFYVRVINNAGPAFEQMIKEKQGTFPDALLTIIFVKLMESQKEQLNKLTRRHLDFYYKNILDQKEAGASPDGAFVFINLNPNTETFEIPAGFQFNAGVDEEQKPVIFESEKDSVVNRTAIDQLYTLSPQYLRHIEKPSTIKNNGLGEVLTWRTFGNSSENNTIKKELTQVKLGFAFASPMLLLESGTRFITITLKLSKNYASKGLSNIFQGCDYYLSTEKKWYKVSPKVNTDNIITITLQSSAPPIVPFKNNPDKLTTSLPMLKVVFPDSFDSSQQILLEEINIQTVVTGMTRFTLSNDNGSLPVGGTFLPFGPVPSVGNRFSLESPELCIPNLSNLTLTIDWEHLPGDFSQYYSAYNSYLHSENMTDAYFYNEAFRVEIKSQNKINKLFYLFQQSGEINNQKSIFKVITNGNKLPEGAASGAITMTLLSNNGALLLEPSIKDGFTVNTKPPPAYTGTMTMTMTMPASCTGQIVMTPAGGDAITMTTSCSGTLTITPTYIKDEMTLTTLDHFNLAINANDSDTITMTPKFIGPITVTPTGCRGTILMTLICSGTITMNIIDGSAIRTVTMNARCIGGITMTPTTTRVNMKITPTGYIAIIMTSSNSGPLTISRTETEYPFGNDLYPKLVYWISLENAIVISKKDPESSELMMMPILPYAPKVKEVTVDYNVETTQSFYENKVKEDAYPFEYYHYSPFGVYPVFSTTTDLDYGVIAQGEEAHNNSVDLFPYMPAKGILYLSLKNLPPLPATLSLYFEMAENKGPVNSSSEDHSVKFWILGKQGWQSLKALEDGTANLRQSGILLFPLPEDIFKENPMMPIDECWLSITHDFKLTELDLRRLRKAGLPYVVVESLKPLVGKVYDSENKFWKDAKEAIANAFKGQILNIVTDYKLTNQELHKLKEAGLPGKVVKSLNPLVGKVYDSENKFWKDAKEAEKALTDTYQNVILINTWKVDENAFKTIYVNTQAINVKRVESNDLAPGITPMIKAGKIVSPAIKTPEIKAVLQPFNSRDGRPAETTDAFYQRVSRRIKTKDRALSKKDYAIMALEADSQLAYAKCLPKKKIVRLELVQSYPDATQPTAFRPVVPSHNQLRLQNFFQKRVSPFVKLEIRNMDHQKIKVQCELTLENPENGGMVKKQLNEELRLFLSPWIQSDQTQIPMDQGIRRSELLSFLSGRPEVVSVSSIEIFSNEALQTSRKENGKAVKPWVNSGKDWEAVFPKNEETLFVSAEKHKFKLAEANLAWTSISTRKIV